MKRIVTGIMLVVALVLGSSVSYAKEVEHHHSHHVTTTTPTATAPVVAHPQPTTQVSLAQPVTSIGNYNDFGKAIRLDWKPVTGAVSYNIYVSPGYGKTSGFTLDHKLTNYAVRYFNRRYVIVDYVTVPTFGWYTVEVVGVDSNGVEGTPGYCSVNVIR